MQAAWLFLNPLKRWQYRSIPGPVGWPIIGNLVGFAVKGVPGLCQELEPKHGKILKFWFASQPWVVISDPEIARKLSLRFNTRPTFNALNVLPHSELKVQALGVFETHDMVLWRSARKGFDTSLLIPASLAQHAPIMDRCVMQLVTKLKGVASSGETVNMWRELGDMTLEVVGECAYGIDFHSVVDGRECTDEQQLLGRQLVEACRTVFKQASILEASACVPLQLLMPRVLSPVVRWLANTFPDAKQTEALKARRHIRDVSKTLMAGWRAAHPKDAEVEQTEVERTDPSSRQHGNAAAPAAAPSGPPAVQISDRSFLGTLLTERRDGDAAVGKHFRQLDDDEVIQQAITFILAGYETTANTLAFAVYLLAVNPEAEARLIAEVDAFGRSNHIAASDLDQAGLKDHLSEIRIMAAPAVQCVCGEFPFTDAVVKETLRLHNPAAFTIRIAVEELQVLGKTVPKDAVLVFPSHTFHNAEEFWPRPSEFLPQRFLPEGQEKLGPTTANAHMPFGIGARMCPGYKFAQQEAKISLVRLYQNFTFALAPGMPKAPRTVTGITTGPADGVPVTVHSRK
ncbi:MAG: hypothetical protein WDW36_001178 [Sanguina aurantia]